MSVDRTMAWLSEICSLFSHAALFTRLEVEIYKRKTGVYFADKPDY
jgi:hypothetical protein